MFRVYLLSREGEREIEIDVCAKFYDFQQQEFHTEYTAVCTDHIII